MPIRSHRLHLNVSDRCNLRCSHCYWEEYGRHPQPSIESIDEILGKFKRFARTFRESGSHILTLGGGEPTIRGDLVEIVRLAVRRGFQVRLVTNATLIDDEKARRLRRAGLKVVQVSLDGATRETHERVRGRGTWDRTMHGITALKRARMLVVLSYVLLPGINSDEAPRLLDLTRELNVAGAKFARPIRDGQALLNGITTEGDFWSMYLAILAHARSIGYQRMLMFFDPLAHLLPAEVPAVLKGLWGVATDLCQCNNTELVEIDAGSGDIYFCRVRHVLGNIWRDDLEELWNNHPLLVGIRRKTAVGSCSGCSAWDRCRGGCPAVVESHTGNAMLQDADCVRVRRTLPVLEFPATGYSNPYVLSPRESLHRIARRIKNAAYQMTLT